MVILINKVKVMKAIKLIIIFIVQLGGVLGALYLLTNGEKDDPAPSSDTNVLPDTTAIGDTAIVEDATDEDNRITDPLDEEETKARPTKNKAKQKAVMNPSEFKQRNNSASEKENTPPCLYFVCTKGCRIGGAPLRFNTQKELDVHMSYKHGER